LLLLLDNDESMARGVVIKADVERFVGKGDDNDDGGLPAAGLPLLSGRAWGVLPLRTVPKLRRA